MVAATDSFSERNQGATMEEAIRAWEEIAPLAREAGIRALAVYNPIHYMEAPELFMEYICSMTGKSPSTTGAGSGSRTTAASAIALGSNGAFGRLAEVTQAHPLARDAVLGLAQARGDDPSKHVGCAARSKGNDERNGALRPFLRGRRSRGDGAKELRS